MPYIEVKLAKQASRKQERILTEKLGEAITSVPAVSYTHLVSCENKTGYFHTREITIILNYLSVVDNVYQDIPMASVMLSSIGGFTEEELTKLRILVREPMREQYTCLLYTSSGNW